MTEVKSIVAEPVRQLVAARSYIEVQFEGLDLRVAGISVASPDPFQTSLVSVADQRPFVASPHIRGRMIGPSTTVPNSLQDLENFDSLLSETQSIQTSGAFLKVG